MQTAAVPECLRVFLEEDEEMGAQRYRYIRTGPDHYSLAFTYATRHQGGHRGLFQYYRQQARERSAE